MALFFGSFELTYEYVFVDLNLLLALLHRHLELILAILKAIDAVGLYIYGISKLLNFELHTVVLDQSLLLDLKHFVQVTIGHLILELELLDLRGQGVTLLLNLINGALDVAALVSQLLVRDGQLL